MQGLEELVQAGSDALPAEEGALYIRPFVFATDARFGYRVSETYQFIIFCGPVGPYYAQPLKVRVETQFVRAADGGTGFAKCAGNYGGAIYPTALAKKAGFDQVLWTDGQAHQYIEESGTMNVMFVINGTLITPPLTTTILDGVTRDSVLQLARYWDIPVEERKISVEEIEERLLSGALSEAFGVGTAATVAPIATIGINDTLYEVPQGDSPSIGSRIKNTLDDIRHARTPDIFRWNYYLAEKGNI
jgi:branched-chain amino acid aminotransferase